MWMMTVVIVIVMMIVVMMIEKIYVCTTYLLESEKAIAEKHEKLGKLL
jgi:hypothetical protein